MHKRKNNTKQGETDGSKSTNDDAAAAANHAVENDGGNDSSLKDAILKLVIKLVLMMIVTTIGFYYIYAQSPTKVAQTFKTHGSRSTDTSTDMHLPPSRLFTAEELKQYDGKTTNKAYLSIVGEVFDVTTGWKHYGPDGGYNFFCGKDGTRAFISGEFSESGLRDDVDGLDYTQIAGIVDWLQFYRKDYVPVGRLQGRYYDENGNPTEEHKKFWDSVKSAESMKKEDDVLAKQFPGCDSKWSQAEGGEVWCSLNSGGIARDWMGVPRQYKRPGSQNPRCACVKYEEAQDNPNMSVYKGCSPKSRKCKIEQ